MYFGASIGIAAGSAVAVFRSPVMMNLVARSGWLAMIGTMAIVSSILIDANQKLTKQILDDRIWNGRSFDSIHSWLWSKTSCLDGTFCNSRRGHRTSCFCRWSDSSPCSLVHRWRRWRTLYNCSLRSVWEVPNDGWTSCNGTWRRLRLVARWNVPPTHDSHRSWPVFHRIVRWPPAFLRVSAVWHPEDHQERWEHTAFRRIRLWSSQPFDLDLHGHFEHLHSNRLNPLRRRQPKKVNY